MNMQPDNPNALPVSIYNRNRLNYISLAFIGMFGADGCNSNGKNVAGIGFRSTNFPALYDLLVVSGVREHIIQ